MLLATPPLTAPLISPYEHECIIMALSRYVFSMEEAALNPIFIRQHYITPVAISFRCDSAAVRIIHPELFLSTSSFPFGFPVRPEGSQVGEL